MASRLRWAAKGFDKNKPVLSFRPTLIKSTLKRMPDKGLTQDMTGNEASANSESNPKPFFKHLCFLQETRVSSSKMLRLPSVSSPKLLQLLEWFRNVANTVDMETSNFNMLQTEGIDAALKGTTNSLRRGEQESTWCKRVP